PKSTTTYICISLSFNQDMESGCCRLGSSPGKNPSAQSKCCAPRHSSCTCPSPSCGSDTSPPCTRLSRSCTAPFRICSTHPPRRPYRGEKEERQQEGGRRNRERRTRRPIDSVAPPHSAADAHRLARTLVRGGALEAFRRRMRPALLDVRRGVRRLARGVAVVDV